VKSVRPLHYFIRLVPDPEALTFTGETEIHLETQDPLRDLILHSLDLDITACRVFRDPAWEDCEYFTDPQRETLTLRFPSERSGTIRVRIIYGGRINRKMAGFYRSTYRAGDQEKILLSTQFEESDARRAFPCMDHPSMKATFDLELVIDEHLEAVSNMPVLEVSPLEGGKKRILFQRTPRMSTYLLFFGVGEWEFLKGEEGERTRLAAVRGMARYGHFALAFASRCLSYCEEALGVPYPLPKMDLLAVPDFAFGAMENWGAIAFRENLLLKFPDTTSRAGQERICEVIAHEMAHQWFGNLVTPADWKYLWLNESFATFFAYGVLDHFFPDWGVWEHFILEQTATALDRDAFWETVPIEIPGGEHVVINTSTAPIIYNKGGSILRQVKGLLGESVFQEGVRAFLEKFQYRCAASSDLWETLQEVSDRPVTGLMKGWIETGGHPLLEVRREEGGLVLRQRRFTFLPNEDESLWPVPLSVRMFDEKGGSRVKRLLIREREARIPLEPGTFCFKLNDHAEGFYRVRYLESSNLDRLASLAARKVLSPTDRWNLQDDFYALVKACDAPLESYLDFLVHYREENAYLPLSGILSNLQEAALVYAGERQERIRRQAEQILRAVLQMTGFDPHKDEPQARALLRDRAWYAAAAFGLQEAEAQGLERFSAWKAGEPLHPDIARSVMEVGALCGGRDTLTWFADRLEKSPSEHERLNILTALGRFRDPETILAALRFTLDSVPDRNKFVPLTVMGRNPEAIPLLWDWYKESLQALENLHPLHYERVVAALLPLGGLGREEEVREFFEEYFKNRDKARAAIRLSLERMEVYSRMREAG